MAEATDSVHLAQLLTRLSIATRTRALQVVLNLTKLDSAPTATAFRSSHTPNYAPSLKPTSQTTARNSWLKLRRR
jgi:hypothetical protein